MGLSLPAKSLSRNFILKEALTPAVTFYPQDLVIGYDEPLSTPLNLSMERGQKIALIGSNGILVKPRFKSILGLIRLFPAP